MRVTLLILTLFCLFFEVGSVFASSIKINEFYTAGTTSSNPDWVEVYNDGTDISLYQLMDAVNNKKDLAGSSCNGNYCTINWYNYLNNSGDTIKLVLKTAIDSPIDQVTYPGDISIPSSEQSASRNIDGTGSWIISSSPTKGSTNNSSTPTPSMTATPSTSPTPSLTSSSTSSTSSFLISNTPSQINSDQSFTIQVSLFLPDNPNTSFFLKGAFKKSDGSNYFGQTKVSDNWVKNGSSYSNQFPLTTDSTGNWSGTLEIQPDSEDSGFTGSGDYIFKVGRYNSSGSGPTWSNEVTINIVASNFSNNEQTNSTTTQTNLQSSSSTPTPSPKAFNTKSITNPKVNYQIASVAGTSASALPTSSPTVKSQKQINLIPWVGFIFIIAGFSSLAYILIKNGTISNLIRSRN